MTYTARLIIKSVLFILIRLFMANSWLRHYATSWNVMSLIPDEVTGFFYQPTSSSHTTALAVNLVSNKNEYQESSWV
jgi:hypothetical protein